MIPAHERVEQLWLEADGDLSSPEIAARLAPEGYGAIRQTTVRTWKKRHGWSLAKQLALNETGIETVAPTFPQMSDALLTLGVGCAEKLIAFVKDCKPTEMTHAEALSRIMNEAIAAASTLDQGVLARYRAAQDARNGDNAKAIEGTSTNAKTHDDGIVAMFTRANRKPGKES
jgi:hypothetical protein